VSLHDEWPEGLGRDYMQTESKAQNWTGKLFADKERRVGRI